MSKQKSLFPILQNIPIFQKQQSRAILTTLTH